MTDISNLSNRLKALGVKLGAHQIQQDKKENFNTHLIKSLGGVYQENHQGEIFTIETKYPVNFPKFPSGDILSSTINMMLKWYHNDPLTKTTLDNIIFYDTETTSLGAGSGTLIFLHGVACIKNDNINLIQYFLQDPAEETAQLFALEQQLVNCRAIVTYNGKSFDIPLLKNRFIIQGRDYPFQDIVNIDLLFLSRRLWKNRLASCTLINVEKQILKIHRSEEDVPGWMVPQIYFDYLHHQDTHDLPKIIYHNAMDVISLVFLFLHISAILIDPDTAYDGHFENIIAIGKLHEDINDHEKAKKFYRKLIEKEAPDNIKAESYYRLAQIYKRCNNYASAISLWESAAQLNNYHSFIELAKYYEHRIKNFEKAIYWTLSAINKISKSTDKRNIYLINELEHRLKRLKRIIGD